MDGENKILEQPLNLSPTQWHEERIDVPKHPAVRVGVGISVCADFAMDGREIEFSSAGCDFQL